MFNFKIKSILFFKHSKISNTGTYFFKSLYFLGQWSAILTMSRDAGKTEDVCLHLFFRIVQTLCRETFINRTSLRNVNVHAQLPVGRERGRE